MKCLFFQGELCMSVKSLLKTSILHLNTNFYSQIPRRCFSLNLCLQCSDCTILLALNPTCVKYLFSLTVIATGCERRKGPSTPLQSPRPPTPFSLTSREGALALLVRFNSSTESNSAVLHPIVSSLAFKHIL